MNPVKKLGLKVGQLFKMVFEDGSGGVYQKIKHGGYQKILSNNDNKLNIGSVNDWEEYNLWDIPDLCTLTTAYDCGINPSELPVPEPIDSTGWVVYRKEIDGSRLCTIPKKIKNIFIDCGREMVRYEKEYGNKDLVEDLQPCLPPTDTEQKEWEPKEGDLVWAYHQCSDGGAEKVKVITDLDGNLAFLDSDLNVTEPDDWEWYEPYTGQDKPEPTLKDEIYDALTYAFAGYDIDVNDIQVGVNNVMRVLETPKPEEKPTWPPVPGQDVYMLWRGIV